jgi:hypothetical protein
LKSGWKPPQSQNSCVLQNQYHVDDAKVCCQFEQYLDPFGSRLQWPPSAWATKHGEMNHGEWLPRWPCVSRVPWRYSLLKRKSFQWVYTWPCHGWGSSQSLRCPQGILFIVSMQSMWFLSIDYSLLQPCSSCPQL